MKSKHNRQSTPQLTDKEKFIEFAAIGTAVLLLLACAIKVLFI